MKGGWRTGTAWWALLASLLLAPAALRASDEGTVLTPYAPTPDFSTDPALDAVKSFFDRAEAAPTIGSGFQVSLLAAWTHFGYGSQLKPRGFGAGLRFDIGWSDKVAIFLEARAVRGVADGTRSSGDYVEVLFDAATGILGLAFLLPGSNLAHSDETISDAPFFHQIEFGAVAQRFKVDEDMWDDATKTTKTADRQTEKTGNGAALRYRVGSKLGEGWFFSFTGGIDVVLRDQLPPEAFEPFTAPLKDRWEVDVTFTLVIGADF